MPIYEFECGKCGERTEEIYSSLTVIVPQHCDVPMQKIPSICGSALVTKGGNWYRFEGAHGPVSKGNRRPVTRGRGHGIGGSRPHLQATLKGER